LAVGGVKEKVLAAHRHNIKRVLLPRSNDKDLVRLPKEVLRNLEIVLIDNVEQAVRESCL
jgi:ATP-dependent Lon protease